MKRTCAILMTLVLLMLCSCPVQAEDGLPDAPENLTQTQQELLAYLYEPLMRWEPAIRRPAHAEDPDLAAAFIELICSYPEMSHVIGYSEQYIPDTDSDWILPEYTMSGDEAKAVREKLHEQGEIEGLPYAPETIISVRNLTQTQRELMAYLYEPLMACKEEIPLPPGITSRDVHLAIAELLSNYPELLHLDRYTGPSITKFDAQGFAMSIGMSYVMSKAAADSMRNWMYRKADALLSSCSSPLEIHDMLISTVDYSKHDLQYCYTAAGALVQGRAVCNGYAQAMCLLYRLAGIPCGMVVGRSKDFGESHAWNIARIDGRYTLIDATWDDPGDNASPALRLYYGLSTAQMAVDHVPDEKQHIPLCHSLDK